MPKGVDTSGHPGRGVGRDRFTHPGTRLNADARKLAPQGDADRLWEMADYHALKGNYNDEEAYRRAARLREQG